MKDDAIAGLDIGSTKTCVVVAVPQNGIFEVIGIGEAPVDGLQRGVVTNFESVVRSIELATEAAERMAGVSIAQVYLGMSGDHVRTRNSRASIAISNDQHEVHDADVARALEASQRFDDDDDRRILHALPRSFVVDGYSGIVDPLGMEAKRLEVDAHVVTGASPMITNVLKCVSRAGLEPVGIVFEPLASSASTLDRETMESGVMLLDIGGGSTNVALYSKARMVHTAVIPVGSEHLTRDISMGLRTTMAESERLKRDFDYVGNDERVIDVSSLAGKPECSITHGELRAVLAPRLQEIFHMVRDNVAKVADRDLHIEEIVVTGGGANLLGIERAVSEFFGLPARVGLPSMIEGLTDEMKQPQYATAVGLLVYGPSSNARPTRPRRQSPFRRLATWISDLWN
jgi:cell division protein FtsA